MSEPRTIVDLARALRERRLTAVSATSACLAAIQAGNPSINAFITVLGEQALADAARADEELAGGCDRGPLHGVPVALKDLIDVAGVPTTAASSVRRAHVASADAPVVTRLREAGAVILGKNNLHEFAFGTTNEDSAFGLVRHPLDPTRSPGGSSGGSAAAVLAGMAYAAIGTDTGGSIRIPSAACGLVGLKPTLGEIPTEGVVPLSTTMDHVGPICRSVADARLVYDVLRGAPPTAGQARDVASLRLGVPGGYVRERLDEEVLARFDRACERLRAAGVGLEPVVIPHLADAPAIYLHIVLAEAAAYHAVTLEHTPDAYTPNVRLRLEMGRYVLAEDYVRALRGRQVLAAEVEAALDGHDGLLLPTLAMPAVPLGTATVRVGAHDEPVRTISMRLTQPFNLSGHPAITMPCGATSAGLPVGAQLVGRRQATPALLAVAAAMEPVLSQP